MTASHVPLVPTDDAQAARSGPLPVRLHLLCVDHWEPSWIGLTLQLAAVGCHEPQFRWVSTVHDALTALRERAFECVLLVGGYGHDGSARADGSLALLGALRSSGYDEPVVLIAPQLDESAWADAVRWDAEILIAARPWESAALGAVVCRAVLWGELRRENRRLAADRHRRLLRERDEADHLLAQQQQVVRELEALAAVRGEETERPVPPGAAAPPAPPSPVVPPELSDHYHELLRAYVILGSGNVAAEIDRLAEQFLDAGLGPREALQQHLERVEGLVRGLGHRSTRHVTARADLLILELMMRFAERAPRTNDPRERDPHV